MSLAPTLAASTAPAGGAATIQVIEMVVGLTVGDVPYVRPSSGREAMKAARSFPLTDYRYDSLRPAPGARAGA